MTLSKMVISMFISVIISITSSSIPSGLTSIILFVVIITSLEYVPQVKCNNCQKKECRK